MTAKICVIFALAFCVLSVYFNKRSDAWADRCLYLVAYTALFFGVWTLWR